MKRRSLEEYQRERREREAQSSFTTPGDDERRERIKAQGLESLRRLKSDYTWEDWIVVGEAMMVITEEAMEAVGASVWDPNNRQLTREFMARWDEYEYQAGDNQKPLSKQERWALREVMTHPEIGAWRATLDGVNRRKLNHPNKVIERWRRATQTSEREPKKPAPSMSQALKERDKVIEEQEARIKELEEEAEGRGAAPQTLEAAREAAPVEAEPKTLAQALDAAVQKILAASTLANLKDSWPSEATSRQVTKAINDISAAYDALSKARNLATPKAPPKPKRRERLPRKGEVLFNVGGLDVVMGGDSDE
jgi:hypothetical protein